MKKKHLNELKIEDFFLVIPESYIKEILYAKDYKKFEKFMTGQTMSMASKNEMYIYPCDLDRFIKGLSCID